MLFFTKVKKKLSFRFREVINSLEEVETIENTAKLIEFRFDNFERIKQDIKEVISSTDIETKTKLIHILMEYNRLERDNYHIKR